MRGFKGKKKLGFQQILIVFEEAMEPHECGMQLSDANQELPKTKGEDQKDNKYLEAVDWDGPSGWQ